MKKSAKKVKVKAVKRKSKSAEVSEAQMPSLVEAMLKLTERLEAVERKMDLVVNQTSSRSQLQQPKPSFQNPPRQEHRQPQLNPLSQHSQNQQHQNFNRQSQPQNQNRHQHPGGGRPMFQTTCADCGKSCEVPFKPTGERPIYCKECFGLRKSGGQSQKPQSPAVSLEKRELKVVKNGVGRTVISEMVAVSERQSHPVKKISKPAKKSKR